MEIDPIERDPNLKETIQDSERQARERLDRELGEGWDTRLGSCYIFWREKKRILKEKHGIDWKSPKELNPDVIFD